MLPMLRPGDKVFAFQTSARLDLSDGDVIVFRHENNLLVKRILALPGETISGDHRKIFRDGKQVDEPYLAPATDPEIPELVTFVPRKVGAGEVFVMGDNRDFRRDSRMTDYGPVRISDVVGRYAWTYWHASAKSN